jgi:hypothetical protein
MPSPSSERYLSLLASRYGQKRFVTISIRKLLSPVALLALACDDFEKIAHSSRRLLIESRSNVLVLKMTARQYAASCVCEII